MAALILAIRPPAASLSFVLSLDVLVRGVRLGETLRIELGADAVLEFDAGALLPPPALADAELEPLTLRRASMAAAMSRDCTRYGR